MRTRALPLALSFLPLLVGCERMRIDPAVLDRPLPAVADPVDAELAQQGAILFSQKCVACHKWEEALVGPPLKGAIFRREPDWIRAMILSPDSMLASDSIARSLQASYVTPMAMLQLSELEFRALWEYLRLRETQDINGRGPFSFLTPLPPQPRRLRRF